MSIHFSILSDNLILTDDQQTHTFNMYGGRLEQAAGIQMGAITQGEHGHPQAPDEPEHSREDGFREPNADGQAQPPTQAQSQSNSIFLPLKSHSESLGGLLKHISEEEGTEHGKYAWNWKKPGGGPPWQDIEEASLPVVEKTYLLRNVYTSNIKQALQSLESQTSLLSSGEISLQTGKLTSVSWLKINMPGSPHMIPPLILGTMSSSPLSLGQNPKPKLKTTHNGILPGRNIQQWFCSPTHIGEMSSRNMANISLADSSQTLIPFSISNTTLLPINTSMDTKTSPMLTSASSLTCPSKSTCHRDSREAHGEMTGAFLALVKVPDKEGVRGSTSVVHQNSPSVMNSTNQPGAGAQTANSSINVQIVPQVATLILNVLGS